MWQIPSNFPLLQIKFWTSSSGCILSVTDGTVLLHRVTLDKLEGAVWNETELRTALCEEAVWNETQLRTASCEGAVWNETVEESIM